MNPFSKFKEWLGEEQLHGNRMPGAGCLSTIGTDGFPNARFVALKEILDETFVITGPLNSRKSIELLQTPKVALTFWWSMTERQIRIQGRADKISDTAADWYFNERPLEAQVISCISEQGMTIDNPILLNEKYQEALSLQNGKPVKRPEHWGGFAITPSRIELMQFKTDRFHERFLFQKQDGLWSLELLQP